MNTNMTMSYEAISPEVAKQILSSQKHNRSLSSGTLKAYANDMKNGNWDESVGSPISIDVNGVLRDGQHRLNAIITSGVTINMWVCRGVSVDGIYDNNRRRNNSDQVRISRPDFDDIYKSHKTIAIIAKLIGKFGQRPVSPKDIIKYIEEHQETLDGFFMTLPRTNVPKITITTVKLALYLAYAGGVNMQDITNFYEVLCSGMSNDKIEFPIIAYRNYLLYTSISKCTSLSETSRCQYALSKYLSMSGTKRNQTMPKLIWDFPEED